MTWFFLSFADAALPEGSRFLGACYVCAESEIYAVARAHSLKINPGGEVLCIGPIDDDLADAQIPDGDRERLLSREEIEG